MKPAFLQNFAFFALFSGFLAKVRLFLARVGCFLAFFEKLVLAGAERGVFDYF